MASKKIHHGTQATTCLCSRGSDHWTTEIPTLPHANGAAGAAICLCDLRARLDPKGRSSCCSHLHIEIPRGRPVQIETCMYKCLNTDETHTLDGTGTHTHTLSKHKLALFKVHSVHVYARIHAKKVNISFAAQKPNSRSPPAPGSAQDAPAASACILRGDGTCTGRRQFALHT